MDFFRYQIMIPAGRAFVVALALVAGACGSATATTDVSADGLPTVGEETPTASAAVAPAATQQPSATATQAPAPTATQAPAPTATQAPAPTATQAPAPTATQAPAPTATPAPTEAPAAPVAPEAPAATEVPAAIEQPAATEEPPAPPTEDRVGSVEARRDVLLTFAAAWDRADWETISSLSINPEVVRDAKSVYNDGGDATSGISRSCAVETLTAVPDNGVSTCKFLYYPPEGYAWIFNVTIEDLEGGPKVTQLVNGGDAG